MSLFCIKGYNGEQISLELNEVIGFPEETSIEGGYDIKCTLKIDVGCYHVECDTLYSATGALYRFCDELKKCYARLEGKAEYKLCLENDLHFKVEMTSSGRAFVTGTFQEYPHKENVLHFEMDTDQTCFVSVIQDIENLKNMYGGMEGKRSRE